MQIGQVVLALQLGGRARELDGLARQLRAPQRGGGRARRLHRARAPRASTRSSWATASAATWPRATTCAGTRGRTSTPTAGAWPKTNYRRLWTWLTRPLAERARRNIPPPALRALVRRASPARHVPRRVRLGSLHAHVRAGRGAPDARVVLPLHAAQDRARGGSGTGSSTPRCAGGSSSTTSRARTSAVMINQRYDTPEKLSATDAEVIQWRRLVVTKHYGGRDGARSSTGIPTGSSRTPCRSSGSPCATCRSRRGRRPPDDRGARLSRRRLLATAVLGGCGGRDRPAPGARPRRRRMVRGGGGGQEGRQGRRQHLPRRRLRAGAQALHAGLSGHQARAHEPALAGLRPAHLAGAPREQLHLGRGDDPHQHRAAGAAAGRRVGSDPSRHRAAGGARTTPAGRAVSSAASRW